MKTEKTKTVIAVITKPGIDNGMVIRLNTPSLEQFLINVTLQNSLGIVSK